MMGLSSHQRSIGKSQVWLTPRRIISALGPFDLDPCAAPAPRPWKTAANYITAEQDGLVLPWFGRVWLNPPFDRRTITLWLGKLAEHGVGTALVHARTETAPFFKHVWGKAEGVLFLKGRLHFHLPSGKQAPYNSGAPIALVAYGEEDAHKLYHSALPGYFVPIAPAVMFHLFTQALPSWRDLVKDAFNDNAPTTLQDIYRKIDGHMKTKGAPNWRPKVRQIVQRLAQNVGPSTWKLKEVA